MSNSSRIYRYRVMSSNGSTEQTVFVRGDVDASSLVLNGRTNAEPASQALDRTTRIILQGRGGPKSKISHARSVTVIVSSVSGGGATGRRVVVPVFSMSNWRAYRVGQVGTIGGLTCECVAVEDGLPNVFGRRT